MNNAKHVIVVGGGLAGMSAAVALAGHGYRITLVEKRSALGGRAGSHYDAASGEWTDNCQHILMPCCTNLLDFYRRVGCENKIRFYPEIPFLEAGGKLSVLFSSPLPAPFHLLPSFMRLRFLNRRDKWRIACGFFSLRRLRKEDRWKNAPFLDWLRARGQTRQAIDRFWRPIIASALNEDLERAGGAHAAQVFIEAFLANYRGWWLGIPTVPLSVLYGDNVSKTLAGCASEVMLRTEVQQLEMCAGRVREAVLRDGCRLKAEAFVLALPWHAAAGLLPPEARQCADLPPFEKLEPSPITGIHLWFDRSITDLPFAALPGMRIQWLFNKSRTFENADRRESYLQLVTSASRAWSGLRAGAVLDMAITDLRQVLPLARDAVVLKARVIKETAATFSPSPASDGQRPPATTAIPNLFLAGDWIQTGWPSTMEGAVRGGYLAAAAVLSADGRNSGVLAPDLPPSGFMGIWNKAPARRPAPTGQL